MPRRRERQSGGGPEGRVGPGWAPSGSGRCWQGGRLGPVPGVTDWATVVERSRAEEDGGGVGDGGPGY